jgi:hypothetical protein
MSTSLTIVSASIYLIYFNPSLSCIFILAPSLAYNYFIPGITSGFQMGTRLSQVSLRVPFIEINPKRVVGSGPKKI